VGCKCTKKSFPPNFIESFLKLADCLFFNLHFYPFNVFFS
jgi:hypothetical protein